MVVLAECFKSSCIFDISGKAHSGRMFLNDLESIDPVENGYSNNFYGNHVLASHVYMHIGTSEKKTPEHPYVQSSHD
jgi:hypothetical protein